ncbi:hypothetical protein [Streptomyces sp. DH8]|uniref:hypothetical protein n=1 Tax=Streptomyces sp. DH8 TaxID=2857008 RepID=UPI001E4E419E|nr:hypothetical protein [Streptomyces sp. DH8]
MLRADSDGDDHPRGVAELIIADTRAAPYRKKGSVPLGAGFEGWARPDSAGVTLPAGCAVRMGSTAPYITASLEVPSQDEERLAERGEPRPVEADTARRANATVMREVATRLAERYDCAG